LPALAVFLEGSSPIAVAQICSWASLLGIKRAGRRQTTKAEANLVDERSREEGLVGDGDVRPLSVRQAIASM
jgi:hypothetical protein